MAFPEVSWDQVRRFRLARHHLLEPVPPGALGQVVRDICGVQAQVGVSAALALRARIPGLTRADVDRALAEERSLVKTWCMRGTVHLVDAYSLPMYLGAVRNSVIASERRWMARDGLASEQAEAIVECIAAALAGGPLTRREIGERIEALLGASAAAWVTNSWGGVMKQACLAGVACFGQERGPEVTFSSLRDWLPRFAPLDPRDALGQLLTRYLRCYGPATTADFASWSGTTSREVVAAVERLGDALSQVGIVDALSRDMGQPHRNTLRTLALRSDLDALTQVLTASRVPFSVRLLPSFDQFLLAHAGKAWLVDQANYGRVFRKAGWISPVVLVDGRVAGVWSHKASGRRVAVTVEMFDGSAAPAVLPGDDPLIREEVQDVERFLSGTGHTKTLKEG